MYYKTGLTKTRRAGRRVRRNGQRRATRPRTRVAGVWPVTTTRQRRQRRCLDVDVVVTSWLGRRRRRVVDFVFISRRLRQDDVDVITSTQRRRVIVDGVVMTSRSS